MGLMLQPFFELDSYGMAFRNPADRERIRDGLRKAGLKWRKIEKTGNERTEILK